MPGLLVIGASGAHPAYAAGPFDIMNVGNNECLSEENPAVIVIDPCDDTMRQDWKKVTANGHHLIRNALTGHCLTVSDTGACLPAQEVAGDLYDWSLTASGSLDITVADVMGKGMAAALVTARVRTALRRTALVPVCLDLSLDPRGRPA